MHFLLMLACSPAVIKLGDTATSHTDSADSDTDTDTDADGDSDADSDPSGDYSGEMTGHAVSSDPGLPPVDCSGDCSFTVRADGSLEGEAICSDDRSRFRFEGPLSGNVINENASGIWSVSFGPQPIPFDFEGPIADGEATFSIDSTSDMGSFTATLSTHL